MFDLKDAIETLRLQTKVMAEQNLASSPSYQKDYDVHPSIGPHFCASKHRELIDGFWVCDCLRSVEVKYPLAEQHAIESTDWTKAEVLACLGMHAAQLDKRKITGMAYDLRVVMAWVEAQS